MFRLLINHQPKYSLLKITNDQKSRMPWAIVLVLSAVLMLVSWRDVRADTGSGLVLPDGDSIAQSWLCTGGSCGSGSYTSIDESVNDDSDYIYTGTSGSGGETDEYDFSNLSVAGALTRVTNVSVGLRSNSVVCNGTSGTNCDIIDVRIFIDGGYEAVQSVSMDTIITDRTVSFSGDWSGADDLRVELVRQVVGGGSASSKDDDVRVYALSADITYEYIPEPSEITLAGYIWENNDGLGDANQALVAGNNSIGIARKGEVLNLRIQLLNEGSGRIDDDLALFYDKQDDIWTRLGYNQLVNTGSGNCDTVGGGSDAWQCTTIDATDSIGQETSIAFDPSGNAWVSYYDSTNTNLEIANIFRQGELQLAVQSAQDLTESHVDMTSSGDTANRDDSDCLASATWVNGRSANGRVVEGLDVPEGDSTKQCTEVSWVIDTSQSVSGETYRFVVASKDSTRIDKSYWRGPVAIDNMPTLEISSQNDLLYTHGYNYVYSDCDSDASWGCNTVNNAAGSGEYSSMGFDYEGVQWISYHDTTNNNLEVAKFVGSGGSCSDTAWDCDIIDSDNAGTYSKLRISPSGVPWVVYEDDAQDLNYAKYVGSGGNCDSLVSGSDAWECGVVDEVGSTALHISIDFSDDDHPWIAFRNFSGDLVVATMANGDGSCTNTDWDCELIISSSSTGWYTSVVVDSSNVPTVIFVANTASELTAARYVGSGGDCENSAAWECTIIDDDANIERAVSTIDKDDKIWVAYTGASSYDLKVASYVGSGGGCTSSEWDCEVIITVGTPRGTSIAIDSDGNPWIANHDESADDLRLSKYVGAGGTGCSVGSTWQCDVISATGDVGDFSSIAFDNFGTPWISFADITNGDLKVAKLDTIDDRPALDYRLGLSNSARKTLGTHVYTSGATGVAGTGTAVQYTECSSVTDGGYCAVSSDDGYYQNIDTTSVNQQPYAYFVKSFESNTSAPLITWVGKTSLSPVTANIYLEVYRFGSTNSWENLVTHSASDCIASNCELAAMPASAASEYYELIDGKYYMYVRVYQQSNASSTITLRTDLFSNVHSSSTSGGGLLRHGARFEEQSYRPGN